MSTSVMEKYLHGSAMDAAPWEESKHHRADNGQFARGTGRGKGGEGNDEKNNKKKDGGESDREEMSETEATRIVRRAFEEAKCELKGLKLVGHALRADVNEADEGTLDAVNAYLTKRGLKAKVADKTTFKIAEDGYDDIQVMDDPMLEVLVDLCRIEMVAKDLHYRANGTPFYGLHLLADLVADVSDAADDLNEVYYMGEKGVEPPERAWVASKAAELVGKAGDETSLLNNLAEACADACNAVETVKAKGVTGGTSSVLDEISKKALQAKGLIMRTLKNEQGTTAIDNVISKGFYLAPDEAAQDAGTSEGAKKGWAKRKFGDAGSIPDAKTDPHGYLSYLDSLVKRQNDIRKGDQEDYQRGMHVSSRVQAPFSRKYKDAERGYIEAKNANAGLKYTSEFDPDRGQRVHKLIPGIGVAYA